MMIASALDGGTMALHHEEISRQVIGAAFEVHTVLGPGLLESIYQRCLARELLDRGLQVQVEPQIPVHYKGWLVEPMFRADLIVAGRVLVEVKAVAALLPVHHAQLHTYLKLTGIKTGLLLNFNTRHLRDGITRVVR